MMLKILHHFISHISTFRPEILEYSTHFKGDDCFWDNNVKTILIDTTSKKLIFTNINCETCANNMQNTCALNVKNFCSHRFYSWDYFRR